MWTFVDYKPESVEATKAILTAVGEAAKEYKGRLSVVKLDGHRWGEHAKHFGLSGSLPGIVVEDRENNKNYVFPEESTVTAQALKDHFAGFVAGTLKATTKSQAEPEDNNGPVTVLVGTSFERIVFDDEKDVLVEFYAPWSVQHTTDESEITKRAARDDLRRRLWRCQILRSHASLVCLPSKTGAATARLSLLSTTPSARSSPPIPTL